MILKCVNCDCNFERSSRQQKRHDNLNRRRNFCSQKCLHEWQSEYFRKKREPLIKKMKERLPDGKKRCAKCKELKDISEFGSKNWKRLQSYCKSCLHLFQMRRWNKNKVKAIKYLGGKCTQCGRSDFHPAVYQFHHRNKEEKEIDWNKLRIRSWDKITKELDKCNLVCGNCHVMIEINEELW